MNGTQIKKSRKKKQNNDSTSKTKNVSWANTEKHEYEEKKTLPSTPYPNATKKFKVSANSTPISLSFAACDSDENDDTFPQIENKKRKRSKKKSNWVVTCSEVKPDKTNKPGTGKPLKYKNSKKRKESNERIVNTRNGSYIFDENTFSSEQIANQIFKNMMKDEVHELLAESDSESPDELVPIEASNCDSIIFESSSDESSDLNLDVIFNPPEIKLDEKSCQILEPKIKSLKRNSNSTIEKKINNLQLTEKIKKKSVTNDSETIFPNIDILKKIEYFFGETYCIIILKHPFKLYFNGKLSVIVLSGKLEVLGHVLEFNNEVESEIYNPRGQSFLCLETLESKRNANISNILQKYLDQENLTKICETLKNNDCIIAIRNLKNNMTEYLEKHTAQHLYPNTLQFNKRPLMKLENKLSCLFETETAPLKLYKKHKDWAKIVAKSLKMNENNSRTILCGGKNVGKSTLLRYMINNMLNHVKEVVCIDLDPGQSEFTISGCVSVTMLDSPIFGPNYTHLKNPKKSFFIGDINVTNVLDRYISSVKELLDYCDKNISKELPWIINCMGFSKSIGTDIIVLIIKLLKPNIVVQLESSKQIRNYNSHLTQEFVNNFTPSFPLQLPNNKIEYSLEILSSVAEELVSGEWISEPRFLREMCILSYFSQMLKEDKKEITAAIPYGVKLSSIKLHNVNYSQEHILATINGNLVALCESNETSIETKTPLPCNGFGIVRGIDKESDELYLLTPIQETLLENVNILVRGNIALPPSIFMTTGHQGLVPYIQLGTLQGTSAIPKRSFVSWKVLLNKKK